MSPLTLQYALFFSTLLITAMGWVGSWAMLRGMVTRAISDHDRQLTEIHQDQGKQWTQINATEGSVRELRGVLRLPEGIAMGASAGRCAQ